MGLVVKITIFTSSRSAGPGIAAWISLYFTQWHAAARTLANFAKHLAKQLVRLISLIFMKLKIDVISNAMKKGWRGMFFFSFEAGIGGLERIRK